MGMLQAWKWAGRADGQAWLGKEASGQAGRQAGWLASKQAGSRAARQAGGRAGRRAGSVLCWAVLARLSQSPHAPHGAGVVGKVEALEAVSGQCIHPVLPPEQLASGGLHQGNCHCFGDFSAGNSQSRGDPGSSCQPGSSDHSPQELTVAAILPVRMATLLINSCLIELPKGAPKARREAQLKGAKALDELKLRLSHNLPTGFVFKVFEG